MELIGGEEMAVGAGGAELYLGRDEVACVADLPRLVKLLEEGQMADDMTLTVIPEPATPALLGLAALLMRLRRASGARAS